MAALGGALLPRILRRAPATTPLACLALGVGLFLLPLPVQAPDPLGAPEWTEFLTEIGVIVALMGAGLKLDRTVGWRPWASTWGLLAITMPATIVGAALLGWWMVGLAPAAAVLLGAALAPTDPVLASDVQVGPPGAAIKAGEHPDDAEGEVRFALTSEAGLNDALAFPFTNAAVAMAVAGTAPGNWLTEWLAVDVLYRLAVGLVAGIIVGRLLARLVFGTQGELQLAKAGEGFVALAATLLAYGLTEVVGGYGFLAVFVAAVTLRRREHGHEYHETLHEFAEQTERLLMIGLVLLLGGAIAGGVLSALTVRGALFAVFFLFVLRPLTAWIAVPRGRVSARERGTIAFFGIRGIGSLYYLAYGLNAAPFADARELWALVALVTASSIVIHGVLVTPVMRAIDRHADAALPG